jgi:hypothetical protein
MELNLKSLMVDTKSAWIDYPGFDGFKVQVNNLSRERLIKLRKSCIEQRFDRKLKQVVEDLNEKKFIRAFTDAVVANWAGLKLEYVEQLMLIETGGQDLSVELPYSQENAEALVSNSNDFDEWLNRVVHDLENFRSGRDKTDVEETRDVAE